MNRIMTPLQSKGTACFWSNQLFSSSCAINRRQLVRLGPPEVLICALKTILWNFVRNEINIVPAPPQLLLKRSAKLCRKSVSNTVGRFWILKEFGMKVMMQAIITNYRLDSKLVVYRSSKSFRLQGRIKRWLKSWMLPL